MKIHLLHSNDVHSQIENYMRLGAALRTLRAELQRDGAPVLTFDIGDVLDRGRPETEATGGVVNAAMMSSLGYDGWVFGNNEGLTIAPEQWQELIAVSGAPVLCANLQRLDGGSLYGFHQDRVFEKEGVKIGVFGVTADYPLPYEAIGIAALPAVDAAADAVRRLRAGGCQVVVALSHLGLRADRTLAASVPGIDVILGGHTHQFMDRAEYVGRTAIFQPGKHAMAFGHTVVEVDDADGRVLDTFAQPIAIHPHDPFDPDMWSAYNKYMPDVDGRLHRTVAITNRSMSTAYDAESPFANLLVDSLFAAYPCDMGVMMSGALTASLLPGAVTMGHVHSACTTPTRPLRLTLSGADILSLLNKAIQPAFYDRAGYGFGFRGAVVGYLAVANAQVELNRLPGVADVRAVANVIIDGTPLHAGKFYRIVTCEYLWLAPVFEELQRGRDVQLEVPLVREVLLRHINDSVMQQRAFQSRYRWVSS